MIRRGLLVIAPIVWAFAVLTSYYVYHKPFDVAVAAAIGGTFWSAGCAALIVVTASGAGRRFGNVFPLSRLSLPERVVFESALGLGMTGLVALLAGLAGALYPLIAWGVTLGALLLLRRDIFRWLADAKTALSGLRPMSTAEWWLAAFVALTGGISLLNALGPVASWDALLYHLTGPKWDVAAGRVSVSPFIPPIGFSNTVNTLYTWMLLIGGERSAAPIHWWYAVMLCMLVWQWGRQWGDGLTAWLSVAILLSASTIPILAGWPYIDIALLVYSASSFSLLVLWRENGARDVSWLVASGLMAGLAFGTKFTGGVVGAGLALLVWLGAAGTPRARVRPTAVFGAAAFLAVSPWLLKNLILTGNPLYPFLMEGRGWDSWRAAWFARPGTGWMYTDPLLLLTAPWHMSILGTEGTAWHATVGPLFLIFVPMIFIGWGMYPAALRRWLRDGVLFTAVLYGVWLYGAAESRLAQQPRLLFPLLPVLAVTAAVAYDGLRVLVWPLVSVRRVLGSAVALALALTALQSFNEFLSVGPGRVLIGLQTQSEFLYARLGWHYAAMQSVNSLPAGSRVMFLFEPRAYYCDPGRCIPDGILDSWYHARRLGGTPQSISARWQSQGITHVLVYSSGAEILEQAGTEPITQDDWQALRELQQRYLELAENFGNTYLLYRLRPAD